MSTAEKWIWLDLDANKPVTVGMLCKKKSAEKTTKEKQKAKIRHVMWKPDSKYEMIKKGQTFMSKKALVDKFDSGKLNESHLFVFKSTDEFASRSPDLPMYEGVFYCSDVGAKKIPLYVKAQKKYLKQLYAASEKTNFAQAYDIQEDGIPFWVDRHLFSVANEKANKKKTKLKAK